MKLSIHKKVLILVLGAGLVTFLVLGAFSYYGEKVLQRDMAAMSVELGENSATYTGELLVEQLKRTLGELAEAKAQFIDREMSTTRQDAEILSAAITQIMSHPDDYAPKTLPDPRTEPVLNGRPYRIYAPDIRDNVTPDIQRELELASNAEEVIAEILRAYTGYNAMVFVGGEKGWYICARLVMDAEGNTDLNMTLYFSHARLYEFDPRKRPWYINAKNAGGPVISDLYRTIESDGYKQIGASAPIYNAQGEMIGVAGLDYSNDNVYDYVNEALISKDIINFVLNGRGEVIFSSTTEGVLAVKDDDDSANGSAVKPAADSANGSADKPAADNSADGSAQSDSRNPNRDLRESDEQTLAAAAKLMVDGKDGVAPVKLNGENFYLAFAPMPETGWSFGMLISEAEVLQRTEGTHDYFLEQIGNLQQQMRQEYSHVNKLVGIVLVALLIILFIMSTGLSSRFVKPIHELSDGVREISSGNLDKTIYINTGDEIEHLATCFNAMTHELKIQMANLTRVTAEKERIATELDVAAEIQRGMLPKDFPARSDCELLATMTPAKEVGGDFYDFYMLDETHLAITVADVSGKGISAALFMVISKTVLKNFMISTHNREGLAEVIVAANDKLCANNDAMMFVTAFVGVLDLESGEFTFVNGGHNPPVVYHADENKCDFLDVKKNFVLGPMDGIPFVEQKLTLKRGDLLFLYTDGVTEALNTANEEYLPERLIKFMNTTDCRADLQSLLKNVRADVSAHVGKAEQSDDITMFALRFTGGDQ